jgi:succinate-semialdehyde dehydrogenase/glutarate-semialdehyde dehydrogenase
MINRYEQPTQIQASVCKRARPLRREKGPQSPGLIDAPTVLAAGTPEVTAAREETFGPAASTLRKRNAAAAVRAASGAPAGPGAYVSTADQERAATSEPHVPFGGVKEWGFGRELAAQGCGFANTKIIWTGPARL